MGGLDAGIIEYGTNVRLIQTLRLTQVFYYLFII